VVFIHGQSLVVVGCQLPSSFVSPCWVVNDSGRLLSLVVVVIGGHCQWLLVVVGGHHLSSLVASRPLPSSVIVVAGHSHGCSCSLKKHMVSKLDVPQLGSAQVQMFLV